MDLSFAGPAAPQTQRARHWQRTRANLGLVAGNVALAAVLVSLSVVALLLTTGPAWLSYVLQPLSLLLIPGVLADAVDRNPDGVSEVGVMLLSGIFYFVALSLWRWPGRRPHRSRGSR